MLRRVLLLLLGLLVLAGCATPTTQAPPVARPVPAAWAPCSPEAMARDMRQLGAVLFWVREGARNRLNACQGQPLSATPLPARAPTYRCTTMCPLGFCTTRCRPSF
jgi:uncharacterized lipoprotein YajG